MGGQLSVSVNVSPIQIREADFVDVVHAALADSGLDPARLELEITETSIIEDFTRVAQAVSALSEKGVRFALDDFGAGYTRLAYLHRFAWNTLKLDRSFLESASSESAVSTALPGMRAVIGLAHELGEEVLVERIETEAQLRISRELGCERFQGYLLAKPLARDAVGAWLEERVGLASVDRNGMA